MNTSIQPKLCITLLRNPDGGWSYRWQCGPDEGDDFDVSSLAEAWQGVRADLQAEGLWLCHCGHELDAAGACPACRSAAAPWRGNGGSIP